MYILQWVGPLAYGCCMGCLSRCYYIGLLAQTRVCTVSKKWLRFGFAQNCGFRFGFSFTKLTAVSVFWGRFLYCMLFNVYDAGNDVLPCWIGPTNCQPNCRSDSEQEVQRYGMKKNTLTVNLIMLEDEYCEWNNVKNRPKPPKSVFWKLNRGNWVFGFWILRSVRFVFLENRYPIFSSDSAHP